MPVATSFSSSGASTSEQMMHQDLGGNATSSSSGIPPRGKNKCPPSPKPNFNARSLERGKLHGSFQFQNKVITFIKYEGIHTIQIKLLPLSIFKTI